MPNGAPITGEIVFDRRADAQTVAARCQRPFQPSRGCTLAIGPGRYEIWHADDYAAIHERCHARYEAGH